MAGERGKGAAGPLTPTPRAHHLDEGGRVAGGSGHGQQELVGGLAGLAVAVLGAEDDLAQEGRDIGLINKLKAYSLQDLGADTVDANTMLGYDDDERVYFPAAEMLKQLGIARVRMMTNNPEKIGQLAACGVEVVERVRHVFPSNRHNERYLAAKAARSGHLF